MARQAKRADEQDATSRVARRALKWGRGEVAGIKRRMRRRERHDARRGLRRTED